MAVIDLSAQTFSEAIDREGVVVLDFWAPWCGPCKMFSPIFSNAAAQHADILFAKINTEDHGDLAQHFNIRSIPTLMVVRNRTVVFKQAGALMEGQFSQLIQAVRDLNMENLTLASG